MKINRRDYLKGMGAAGMLVGAAGLGFAQECPPAQATCPDEPPCIVPEPGAPRVWKPRWCDNLPAAPQYPHVKLIFEGLTGIARRKVGNKTVCDIGFHSRGDSPIHHHLEISAYNNAVNPDNCTHVYTTPANEKIKKIELKVTQPRVVDQTFFYQRGRACSRQDLFCYEDFRWIVDFESDYLHGRELEKNKNVYSPTLRVEYGIFYTLRKTASTFRAQTEDGQYVCYLGNVMDMMGANIYIEPGSYVELIVDNKTPTYKISAPGEIYFKNHCMQTNSPNPKGYCEFNPHNLKDKKKRSDFFLNYKAFDRNDSPEYQLYIAETHEQTTIPNVICERSRLDPGKKDPQRGNDEAPCSGVGYGGGESGLPTSP